MTPESILQNFNARLNPDTLEQLNAVFSLELTGEGGGVWTIDARKDEGAGVLEGHPDAHGLYPNLRARISAVDFVRISEGKLKAQAAVMTGKLVLKGDLAYAYKLAAVLS